MDTTIKTTEKTLLKPVVTSEDKIEFMDSNGNIVTMKQLKEMLKRDERIERAKPKECCGFNILTRYNTPREVIEEKLHFPLSTDKDLLKHAPCLIHREYTAFKLEGGIKLFNELMNQLTDNNFGSILEYEVEESKQLVEFKYYQLLYTIHKLTRKDNDESKHKFIIIDTIDREQPGLTDTNPTPNPSHLRIGILINDDTFIDVLK